MSNLRLHLGCGTTRLDGWVNIDAYPVDGVTDLVRNLDPIGAKVHLPFDDDSVVEVYASHFIEHLRDPLNLMRELYRVAAPGCRAVFRCPYGSSDDADEDPTHVRRMFIGSWGYFSQPYHWRSAGYGYTGDWKPTRIQLIIYPAVADEAERRGERWLWEQITHARNVVAEMIAELVAVKPAREARRELQERPEIVLARAEA